MKLKNHLIKLKNHLIKWLGGYTHDDVMLLCGHTKRQFIARYERPIITLRAVVKVPASIGMDKCVNVRLGNMFLEKLVDDSALMRITRMRDGDCVNCVATMEVVSQMGENNNAEQ